MNRRWVLLGLYCLLALMLFYMIFMSMHDSVYFYGDDFKKVHHGRHHPLPVPGHFIAARIVDDYLIAFMFLFFAKFIAPLLGLKHIADIYSFYTTALFSFISVTTIVMLLLYIRLVVKISLRYLVLIGLGTISFFFANVQLYDLTTIQSYYLPFLMSILLLYPFVAIFISDKDVFHGLRSSTVTTALVILSYCVAFSITNVEFFTSVTLLWIAASEVMSDRKNLPAREASFRRAMQAVMRRRPSWFRVNIVLLPVLSLAAAALDFMTERFSREQEYAATRNGFEWYQYIGSGLEEIFLFHFDLIVGVLGVVTLCAAIAVNWSRDDAVKLFKLNRLFVIATIFYVVFMGVISANADTNYLARPRFGIYVFFSTTLVLFSFAAALQKHRAGHVLAMVFLLLAAFQGIYILMGNEHWPPRTSPHHSIAQNKRYSKSDLRNIFSTLYMNHCYGNEEILVYLPPSAGNEPGYPIVPNSRSGMAWFYNAYLELMEVYIVEQGTLGDYEPTYQITNDPTAFRQSIRDLATTHTNTCVKIESSPYFIPIDD